MLSENINRYLELMPAACKGETDRLPELKSLLKKFINDEDFEDFYYDLVYEVVPDFDWESIGVDFENASIEKFINDSDGGTVGFHFGENPSNCPELLRMLIEVFEDDANIECIVARNPFCPSDLLDNLAQSHNGWEENGTQATVAANLNTSISTLQLLYEEAREDELFGPQILGPLASNPNLPDELLVECVKDKDPYLRYSAGKNIKLSGEHLVALSSDTADWSNPWPVFARSDFGKVCDALALNPNVTVELLKETLPRISRPELERIQLRGHLTSELSNLLNSLLASEL